MKLLTTIIFLLSFFIAKADYITRPSNGKMVQPKVKKNKLKGLVFWLDGCLGDVIELEVPSDGYGWFSQGYDPFGAFYYPINPTDTFVLKTNPLHTDWKFSYFSLNSYNGQSHACPIVVKGYDLQTVQLTAGVDLQNVTHMKVSGRYSTDTDTTTLASAEGNYTLLVLNPLPDLNGVALGVQGKSRDVLIEKVRVQNKTYGNWTKTDPRCDTSYNYNGDWSWRLDSIFIYQCYFKNIGQDCIYAGNTDPTGTRPKTDCFPDSTVYYLPMRCSNIDIAHNRVDSCLRTGIQLSGADKGFNQIRDNYVLNCGYEFNQQQGTAYSIGGMTAGTEVKNNVGKNTFIYNGLDFGVGTSYWHDNIFDSAGIIKWNDIYKDLDSFAAANGMTASGGYLLNSNSAPGNMIFSTKLSIPTTTKTAIVKNNRLGANMTTASPNGNVLFADFSAYPGDWTQNNVCCGNTRIDNSGAVTIDRFAYNPGSGSITWPVMLFTCYKQYIKIPKGRKPNPVNY